MATKKGTRKRRVKKNIETGVAHIHSTFNNTLIMITDVQGNAVAWSSAGVLGFKGSRKSTPFAAQMASEAAAKQAMEHGMKTVEVEVKGPSYCHSGRNSSTTQRFSSSKASSCLMCIYGDVLIGQVPFTEYDSRFERGNRVE